MRVDEDDLAARIYSLRFEAGILVVLLAKAKGSIGQQEACFVLCDHVDAASGSDVQAGSTIQARQAMEAVEWNLIYDADLAVMMARIGSNWTATRLKHVPLSITRFRVTELIVLDMQSFRDREQQLRDATLALKSVEKCMSQGGQGSCSRYTSGHGGQGPYGRRRGGRGRGCQSRGRGHVKIDAKDNDNEDLFLDGRPIATNK